MDFTFCQWLKAQKLCTVPSVCRLEHRSDDLLNFLVLIVFSVHLFDVLFCFVLISFLSFLHLSFCLRIPRVDSDGSAAFDPWVLL